MKNKINTVLGLVQIGLSVIWIYQMISLFYYYHYTDILFAFMYPDWVLFMNILLCSVNIFYGVKLIRNKISFKKSYGLMLILIIIGNIINNFYYLI